MTRMNRRWSQFAAGGAALSLSLVLACEGETALPGDEVIGRFRFTAELVDRGQCTFSEVPEGGRFEFEGTFSRNPRGDGAWFSVSGENQAGTWDGQRFAAKHTAPRRFEKGDCDNRFLVTEQLHVAVLSASQDTALGGECPEDGAALLKAGSVPVDADAGVTAPGPEDTGYDAVRACGQLTHRITPVAAPTCEKFKECTLLWRVTGGRRQ